MRRRIHVQAPGWRRFRSEVARSDGERVATRVRARLVLGDRLVQRPLERPAAGEVKIDADVHPDAAEWIVASRRWEWRRDARREPRAFRGACEEPARQARRASRAEADRAAE